MAAVLLPMFMMLLLPAWAITYDLFYNWLPAGNVVLIGFGFTILALQVWMVIEGVMVWNRCQGVLEPQLESQMESSPSSA